MRVKHIVGATVETIVKVAVFALLIMYIYRGAVAAYDYGYRVFAEPPVSMGEGRTISVYVENTASVSDIGKMLEEKGLIRDANLFLVQEFLSENHGKLKPGIYDLSTSMTSQEMMAIMSSEVEAVEEEDLNALEPDPALQLDEEMLENLEETVGTEETEAAEGTGETTGTEEAELTE